MPFYELLHYLALNNDAVAHHVEDKHTGEIRTALGHHYVRSTAGLIPTSTGWVWKYIWCRV